MEGSEVSDKPEALIYAIFHLDPPENRRFIVLANSKNLVLVFRPTSSGRHCHCKKSPNVTHYRPPHPFWTRTSDHRWQAPMFLPPRLVPDPSNVAPLSGFVNERISTGHHWSMARGRWSSGRGPTHDLETVARSRDGS